MRTALVLMLVALAGCATTWGESDIAAGKCASVARPPTHAPMERSRPHSIDPQVALSSFQLHCMKDTPLGL
jgi:hypothetical protein